MTDKVQKIRQEIEKRRQLIWPTNTGEMKVVDTPKPIEQGYLNALKWMEELIDSLPEEPASEDLENQYKSNMRYQHAYTQDDLMKTKSEDLEEAASKYVREDFHERSRADFKAGAEWHKQQMMKDAVEGEYWIGEIHLDTPIIQGYNDGDRIKFIIIKMNNE